MNFTTAAISLFMLLYKPVTPAYSAAPETLAVQEVRAHETLDLKARHGNKNINAGYGDNIRLYLHYLKGDVANLTLPGALTDAGPTVIDWAKVREPLTLSFTLVPGEVFAFHPGLLPEFKDKRVYAVPTSLDQADGYRYIDGLWGNGVCHLASFFNWVGSEAGLKVTAKVNHNFAPIYGVPKIYGTAVYYATGQETSNAKQNLYLENTKPNPVTITISIDDKKVEMLVTETVGFVSTD